jgi:hypothetical protein
MSLAGTGRHCPFCLLELRAWPIVVVTVNVTIPLNGKKLEFTIRPDIQQFSSFYMSSSQGNICSCRDGLVNQASPPL